MADLQTAIDAAVSWVAKKEGNDWSVFESPPDECAGDVAVRECAKLLALRIDRGAPEDMIECQAKRLADMINPPAGPAFSYEATPSVAQQIAVGAAVGLAGAVLARSGLGRGLARQAVRQVAYRGFRDLFRA
jgi:hypothetical protein